MGLNPLAIERCTTCGHPVVDEEAPTSFDGDTAPTGKRIHDSTYWKSSLIDQSPLYPADSACRLRIVTVATYPTLEEVESADRVQLARWMRFLPSPGSEKIHDGRKIFDAALKRDREMLERINARFQEMGGMTPAISKALGW